MVWIIGIGVFLYLLFAFPKQMGKLILGIVAVIAVIAFYSERENDKEKRERDRVTADARYDNVSCTSDFPLVVTFRNGSRRTVNEIRYTIVGYEPGYSSEVFKDYVTSDKIMAPGQIHIVCRQVPPKSYDASEERAARLAPARAQWRITSVSPSFQER